LDTSPIVLDHVRGIALDRANPPFDNYQAFKSNYVGLKILADSVRELERAYIANDPHAAYVVLHMSSQVPDLVPCAFNWFSVTLVNYLRLVALVELMGANGWRSSALAEPANRSTIRSHCTEYVRTVVPDVHLWRNKVAAHFAATDPFDDDNLGTLEQSIMNPVTYKFPHYYVGLLQWNAAGETSELPTWALTKVYEDLGDRFWPEMRLRPVPDSGA
jgi:hypothetical protein